MTERSTDREADKALDQLRDVLDFSLSRRRRTVHDMKAVKEMLSRNQSAAETGGEATDG